MPDGQNATAGAGIVDTYAGLVQSLTGEAESEGEQVLGVSISAATAVVDTIGAVVDPVGAVLNAGVGWLLEHVKFLREPLDALLGNPEAINANIQNLKQAAAAARTLAAEHHQDLRTISGWTGEAAESYTASVSKLAGELDALGST